MTFKEQEKLVERIMEVFESDEYADQHHKHELIQNKLHENPQLNAFMILEKYNKRRESDIIKAADHDMIYLLGVDSANDNLKEITKEELIDLVRCGVSYDTGVDCFYMFV